MPEILLVPLAQAAPAIDPLVLNYGAAGVALVALAGLAWGVWRAASWLGTEVVKPVASKHIEFIGDTQKVMGEMSTTMGEMNASLKTQTAALERLANPDTVRLIVREEIERERPHIAAIVREEVAGARVGPFGAREAAK